MAVLVIRSVGHHPPASIAPTPGPQTLDIEAVPLPPPPSLLTASPQTDLERDLAKHQELVEALQAELEQQQQLTSDLKHQLERQQEESARVLAQLQDYQHSVEAMTAQQARLIETMPQSHQTQAILWGILGLFTMLLLGGGVALVIFALWLMHIQRQVQRPPLGYVRRLPLEAYPPPPYPYYSDQPLPPPAQHQHLVQYEVHPLDR